MQGYRVPLLLVVPGLVVGVRVLAQMPRPAQGIILSMIYIMSY